MYGLFWTLSVTDWKSTAPLRSLVFNSQVIYPVKLIQQICCRKVQDFIASITAESAGLLMTQITEMCVKTAVGAVNTTICWFSPDNRWQQACNGTVKGRERAVDGFCSWICRDHCSFRCWRWRLKMQRKIAICIAEGYSEPGTPEQPLLLGWAVNPERGSGGQQDGPKRNGDRREGTERSVPVYCCQQMHHSLSFAPFPGAHLKFCCCQALFSASAHENY